MLLTYPESQAGSPGIQGLGSHVADKTPIMYLEDLVLYAITIQLIVRGTSTSSSK